MSLATMSFNSQDSTLSNETFGKDASIKLSQLIGSMSISPASRDVVLASKEGLHIIDLDSPYSPPRFLPHRTPWEVADVQWSPFADRDHWVVSTSNQKALVWNLNLVGWRNSIEHVLHGHTRAITDINFSAHHPDKLATCSVDSFVHCWDLRSPGRPANSFSDWFAGATQVKWSRQDEHVIASSHDKFLHIWDDRNGAYPARTIEAHDTKIYGIDWNRFEPSKIVTCSLDKTIKFWDTKNEEDLPEKVIETDFPVWRARHTPFGWGLMVMPQRGNGDLHLYDRRSVKGVHESGRVKPVQVFRGHKGQVKEFLWRAFGTVKDGIDHRDFQLVSWGTDRELRLHTVSESVFADVGYKKGVSKPQRLRVTRRGAKYRTFRDEPTEQHAILAAPPRADSFPASSQFLRVRGRPSTNMGMSRVPVTQFRGWLQAGKSARRTDMHGKGSGRPDTDPISWMRNVKIASWEPEALADEITAVGEKFNKVDFESIDVSQRKARMSLESPWGQPDSTSVYTRVDFKFPKAYPKDAKAIIHVQRTNLISSETQKRLAEDIQKIAEAHKSKGRGCIEAIVRYLLKEQTLDQIINWIMRDSLADSKLIEAANVPQDMSDDSDDDQINSVANVAHTNPNISVPLAKRCAALWAENGKLVCFFRVKDTGPASYLSTLGTGQLDESESSKLFGGFGKFQVDSPAGKVKDMTQTGPDGSDSENSDDSSVVTSSTSSSDSSIGFKGRNRFVPWQRTTTLDSFRRGKSADGSQKSTTLDGTKAGDPGQSPVISIYDLSDLLPANQGAAQDYRIEGSIADVCKHNRGIAEGAALGPAGSAWRLLESSLNSTNMRPLGETRLGKPEEQISIRKRTLTSKDDYAFDSQDYALKNPDSTRLEDRLRTTRLIHGIMQFFDQTADVQMLAMLSAIYLKVQHSDSWPPMEHGTRLLSKSGSTPAERADVAQALQSVQDQQPGVREGVYEYDTHSSVSGRTSHGYAEISTSMPVSTLPPTYSASTQPSSGTPSMVPNDLAGFISAVHSNMTSLAGSPESHRWSRKSNTLATAPPHTRSRPVSPPDRVTGYSASYHRPSKSVRPSPDDNFFNDARSRLKTSLSLANISGYEGEPKRHRTSQNGLQTTLRNGDSKTPAQKSRKKKLRTKFDASLSAASTQALEHLVRPSEDALRQCLYYLQQYLGLLEAWQLWTQRAELMKICAQTSDMLGKLNSERSPNHLRMNLRTGLEIRRCCPVCGSALAPVEKNGVAVGWHCVSQECHKLNRKVSKKQHCSICGTTVNGLSVACLQCGHLTCYDCGQGWFGQHVPNERKRTNSTTLSQTHPAIGAGTLGCPTGCGCSCSSVHEITVPYPETVSYGPDQDLAVTTPRSEGYEDNSMRTSTLTENRNHKGSTTPGVPESAFNALLALQGQSRHRSTSSSNTTYTAITPTASLQGPQTAAQGTRTRDNSISMVDATLGRGLGGGLIRGLSNKGSDSTIRRAPREQ